MGGQGLSPSLVDLTEQLATNTELLQQAIADQTWPLTTQLMNHRLAILMQLADASRQAPLELKPDLAALANHYLPIELALAASLKQWRSDVAAQLARFNQANKAGNAYQRHAQ